MHLSGQPLSAEELKDTGWLRDVVPFDRLRQRASELAEQLAQRDTATQQNMKLLLSKIAELDDAAALREEFAAFRSNWRQNDVAQALKAFLNARSKTGSRESKP
jgi:enoyl-CoA hydratase/carnithine racemase